LSKNLFAKPDKLADSDVFSVERLAMYPSDLTQRQWAILQPLLVGPYTPSPKGGRPPISDVRNEVNAILYVLKTGCQWRQLPSEFGHWSKVYARFRRWRLSGAWHKALDALRQAQRLRVGKKAQPSVAIIDSQSVKTTSKGGSAVLTQARKSKGASVTLR
jgi:transposase